MQSLKGGILERGAIKAISVHIPEVQLEEANGFLDEELRVDILIKNQNRTIAGVQVKPLTLKKMRNEVISFNKIAHKKWDQPLSYLFYDENDSFVNLEEVVSNIKQII